VSVHPISLLVGCEADHAPFLVGIPERGEDPATNAEVGMTVVRLFEGVFEAERNTSESGRRHALMFDRRADAVKLSTDQRAGRGTTRIASACGHSILSMSLTESTCQAYTVGRNGEL